MIILAATTDKLQLISGQAVTLDVHVSYVDFTSAGAWSDANKQNTAITTATTTDILAAPAASTRRNCKAITVRNKHATSSCDVTVVYDQSGTDFELHKVTLKAGEVLEFVDGVGFFTIKAEERMDLMLACAADVVNATTSFADITGLTVSVKAGRTYLFNIFITVIMNATTTGYRFGVNGPASPTYLRVAGTAGLITGSITAPVFSYNVASAITTYDTAVHGAVITGPATDVGINYWGAIIPSADGTFAARSQSEVAVASALTVRRGSWMQIREADN